MPGWPLFAASTASIARNRIAFARSESLTVAAALAGGGAGAVTGGLIGALVGMGIPESNSEAYQEALRSGGVVLGVVPHNDDDADAIKEDFQNLKGENICYC